MFVPLQHPLDALRNKTSRDEAENPDVVSFVKLSRGLGIAMKQEAKAGMQPTFPEVDEKSADYLGKDWRGLNDVSRSLSVTYRFQSKELT